MASLQLPPPTATSATSHHVGADSSSSSSSSSLGGKIGGSPVQLGMVRNTHLRILRSIRRKSNLEVKASKEPLELTQGLFKKEQSSDPFEELKHRFLRFKKQNYLDNPVHFQKLAEAQAPKFMVVACADSRVCPSKILGFQPGEAFTVRNVANIVPPFQHGTSETSAALQFAVNSLEVSNILVVGHSRCGGIQALMSMEESEQGSFTGNWVSLAKSARLSTKAAAGHLSFEQQCRHCEKQKECSALTLSINLVVRQLEYTLRIA